MVNMMRFLAFLSAFLPAIALAQPNSQPGFGDAPFNGTSLNPVTAPSFITSGIISQTITNTWSSGYPGTNNLGIYSTQTYTGTPTTGVLWSGGNSPVENLWNITSDQSSYTPAFNGALVGYLFKYNAGGGASAGGHISFAIDAAMTGAVTNYTPNFEAFHVFEGALASANFAGAAPGSGNGVGSHYAISTNYCGYQSGVWLHECAWGEQDIGGGAADSSTDYLYGMKFINFARGASFTATGSGTNLTVTSVTGTIVPLYALDSAAAGACVPAGTRILSQTSGTTGGAGVYVTNNATTCSGVAAEAFWAPNVFGNYLNFASTSPASSGLLPHIIVFGDPQATSGGFPGTSTGDLIYAFTGVTGTAINLANLTINTALITGPGFKVDGGGYVHTNRVYPLSGTQVLFENNSNQAALTVNLPATINSSLSIVGEPTGSGPAEIVFSSSGSGGDLGGLFKTGSGATAGYKFSDSSNLPDFVIGQVTTPISYPLFTPAASGNILFDVGGTASGISIGVGTATGITLSRAAQTTTINGTTNMTGAIQTGGTPGIVSKTCTINTAGAATGITITITNGLVTGTTTC